jgi:hypothetical protein
MPLASLAEYDKAGVAGELLQIFKKILDIFDQFLREHW